MGYLQVFMVTGAQAERSFEVSTGLKCKATKLASALWVPAEKPSIVC